MNREAFILLVIVSVVAVALISSSVLDQGTEAKKKTKQKIKIKNDCGKGVTCSSCGINISGGKIQIKGDC